MIGSMVDYSLHFLRAVAEFLISDVALVFEVLVFMALIFGTFKSLFSCR